MYFYAFLRKSISSDVGFTYDILVNVDFITDDKRRKIFPLPYTPLGDRLLLNSDLFLQCKLVQNTGDTIQALVVIGEKDFFA